MSGRVAPPRIIVMNAGGSGRETILDHFGSPDFKMTYGQFEWNAHYDRVLENSVDIAHAPFVHGGSFGNRNEPEVEEYTIKTHGDLGAEATVKVEVEGEELHTAAEHEMVVTLDDFMRRRSKIDLVVRDRDILGSPGLAEVAGILFGDAADARLADYVASKTAHA